MRNRPWSAAAAAALFAWALVGCGPVDEPVKLEGAIYAHRVPVYPSATYDGTMGGTYSGSFGGPAISQSQSWFFNTDDSVEKVAAWYEERLPDASREEEDGEVTLSFVPEGAEEGEKVNVFIRPGRFSINEEVKPGKIQDAEIELTL